MVLISQPQARSPMQRLLAISLVVLTALVGAGCGSKGSTASSSGTPAAQTTTPAATGTTPTTHFAKTKFVLHAGLAFGAFHRYIYKPFKTGRFSGGLLHHKLATVKAALAAAFAYHEVKLALNDARSSKILSTALAPLLALQTKLGSLTGKLKHGSADAATIQSAQSDTGTIGAAGARAGQPIADQPTPSLGG
jgi:hypothetical protein